MTTRSTVRTALLAFVAALVLAPLAAGHAELSPDESPAGAFKRFVLHLANEELDATTVEVVVQFPESVATATFAPAPGWTRTVKTAELDQPIIGPDGEEIDERIDTVTWENDGTASGDVEFTFRFQVPEQPGATIFFPTVQTYSNDTVVRWIGAPGSDEPAPGVLITEAIDGGTGTGTGETETEPVATTTIETTVTTGPETLTEPVAAPAASEDDDGSNLPLIIFLVALAAALGGLGYWLYRRNQDKQPPQAGGPAPPDEQLTQRIDPPDEQQTQRIDPPDRPA